MTTHYIRMSSEWIIPNVILGLFAPADSSLIILLKCLHNTVIDFVDM